MRTGPVLVTGASGAIGPAVVEALLEHGYGVRAFARHPADVTFSKQIDTHFGDISNPAEIARAAADVSAVVHLAARLHFAGPASRDIEAYRRVNVEGTRHVVRAASEAGAGRVVFASTIAVYGSSRANLIDERTPPHPDTPYAISKREAEEIVLDARGHDGESIGIVLRLAAVYGSRVKGNYRSLVHALARGRFVPIGDGTSRRTVVHDGDVGRAIVHALETPLVGGRTYNVTDGSVHTTDEIVAAICGALGRPLPRWRVPGSFAFGAAAILDELHRLTGRGAGTFADRLKRYVENVIVDGALFQRETGFRPVYDLASGWRQVVERLRALGTL